MEQPGAHHPPSIIRLEGVLDGVAARRVEAELLGAEPGDRVLVDMTQVREFHDFGVAVLGRAISRSRADVRLRGLRQHQLRVLRFFGVDADPVERAVIPDGI